MTFEKGKDGPFVGRDDSARRGSEARDDVVAGGLRLVPRFAVLGNPLSPKFARHLKRVTQEFFWRG